MNWKSICQFLIARARLDLHACKAMRQERKNRSLFHIIRFLTDHNDNFVLVRSEILLMDP